MHRWREGSLAGGEQALAYGRGKRAKVRAAETERLKKERYNESRPHWALVSAQGGDPITPRDVYVVGVRTRIPKWQARAETASNDST